MRQMKPFTWTHDEACEADDVAAACSCEDRARAAYDREVDRLIDEERDGTAAERRAERDSRDD